jgi:hypothetical protein
MYHDHAYNLHAPLHHFIRHRDIFSYINRGESKSDNVVPCTSCHEDICGSGYITPSFLSLAVDEGGLSAARSDHFVCG